jgi:hypothetical protein
MRKILIFDTSILCVYLQVPNKETAGSDYDKWDKKRVDQVIKPTFRTFQSTFEQFYNPYSVRVSTIFVF